MNCLSRMTSRGRLLATLSSAALIISTPAFGQDTSASTAQPVDTTSQPSTASTGEQSIVNSPVSQTPVETGQGKSDGTIFVTGSRVARTGFAAPTPVTVLTTETLQTTNPQSLTDGLRQVPQLLGTNFAAAGRGEGSNASNAGASTGAFLNLRRLGPVRTLLLQDGFRVAPTRADGTANADLLPQLLVDRVEIVTGGASAVYGSDAVAGVVNFITNTKFEGLKGVVQGGMAQRGDYESYRVGLAGGVSLLADKLHIIGSVERSQNNGIGSQCDRDLGCKFIAWGGVHGAVNAGTPSNPLIPYYYAARSVLSFGGRIATGPAGLAGMNFDDAGNLVPSVGVLVNNGTCIMCDGSNNGAERTDLVPKVRTNQAYGRAELEVSDAVQLWGQFSYGRIHQFQEAILEANQGTLRIFNGNAFLPANVQAILGANGPTSSFTLGKHWITFPSLYRETTSESLSFAGGLKGTIASRFKWNVGATWGRSTLTTFGRENLTRNLAAAIDAVRDPVTNEVVCRVTITNPTTLPGCVPLDPIGVTTASQAGIDFVRQHYTYDTRITQKTVAADIGGDLFNLWAGPVTVNVGAEYRKLSLDAQGNQIDFDNSGIRFGGLSSTLTWTANNVFPSAGSYDAKEVYGETIIPLLKDVPLVKSLELNAAGRITDYSTSGSVKTWKLGGVWRLSDELRFRATQSRDIRAPNLNELFAPFTVSLGTTRDPVSNTSVAAEIVSSGNLNLKPEVGDTTALGAVFSPRFLRGFTASVDWYRIKMKNLIAQPFSAQQIVDRCFQSGGTDPVCDRITRPTPTSPPSRILTGVINVSNQTVEGIDAEFTYHTKLGRGALGFTGIANYQYKSDREVFIDAPIDHLAGYDFSKFNGTLLVNYDVNDWSFAVRSNLIGKRRNDRTLSYLDPVIGAIFYADLNIAKKIKLGGGTVETFLNIQNLFDKQPPLVAPDLSIAGYIYPTDQSVYDVIGRRFTVGVRFAF